MSPENQNVNVKTERSETRPSFEKTKTVDDRGFKLASLDDGRRVVVKHVNGWADLRVASLLHSVRSPYLPRCFGWSMPPKARVSETEDKPYRHIEYLRDQVVMDELPCYPMPREVSLLFEWIDGRSLREVDKKELTSSHLERWFDDILEALTWVRYCAGAPFAHLDISPDNIVITHANKAVLIDFAGARILDQDAWTPETSRVYKEGYAAPEIFLGQLSPESDLFSLAMSMLSVWRGETASTMNQSSLQSALRKLDKNFAERLRTCLSEIPESRRAVLRKPWMRSTWELHKKSDLENGDQGSVTEKTEDHCPYTFSTCPFLEVAYIICGD